MVTTEVKKRKTRKTRKCKDEEDKSGEQSMESDTSNKPDGKSSKDAKQSGTSVPTTKDMIKRSVVRCLFIVGAILVTNYYQKQEGNKVENFVKQSEVVSRKSHQVECSNDYLKGTPKDCAPKQCGRVVMDGLVKENEAKLLVDIAKRGLAEGGSSGGASILDLHSGALSMGENFVDIYKMAEGKDIFTQKDFQLYRKVKERIRVTIMQEFGVTSNKLYLTKPTFFSRMTTKSAKTIHDEYWHPHVDKETYGSFDYTSLIYLADYGQDFTGGRFVFVDKDANRTMEPRMGRVSFFTSGSENLHYVEKLSSGTRYAMTVSFTCSKSKAIKDPSFDKINSSG